METKREICPAEAGEAGVGRSGKVAVLIPAYEPDGRLAELVGELAKDFAHIVVVDDGSERGEAFVEAEKIGAKVLRHAENRGKGAALRTGFGWIAENLAGVEAAVTADCDGQHRPEDVKRVAEAAAANPGRLTLGVRSFKGRVPFRSRFGNWWACLFFRMAAGFWVSDTQTGLRGVPRGLFGEMLGLEGDRYEYEMRMLTGAKRHSAPPLEVPIATVYIDENRGSHFRPFRDAVRTQAALWGSLLRKP